MCKGVEVRGRCKRNKRMCLEHKKKGKSGQVMHVSLGALAMHSLKLET